MVSLPLSIGLRKVVFPLPEHPGAPFEPTTNPSLTLLLTVRQVEKVWSDSTVARIVRLTEEAAAGRPKLQKWVDEFGERYSQVVVALSALVGILGPVVFGWPLFGRGESPGAIYRALGLMVAMSPCALAAAPLSYVAGIR